MGKPEQAYPSAGFEGEGPPQARLEAEASLAERSLSHGQLGPRTHEVCGVPASVNHRPHQMLTFQLMAGVCSRSMMTLHHLAPAFPSISLFQDLHNFTGSNSFAWCVSTLVGGLQHRRQTWMHSDSASYSVTDTAGRRSQQASRHQGTQDQTPVMQLRVAAPVVGDGQVLQGGEGDVLEGQLEAGGAHLLQRRPPCALCRQASQQPQVRNLYSVLHWGLIRQCSMAAIASTF